VVKQFVRRFLEIEHPTAFHQGAGELLFAAFGDTDAAIRAPLLF
jgi:hypothetical protein